jgi:hypothetical protein
MEDERAEAAESVRRFRDLSRAQALSGLEFLTWQERVPDCALAIAAALLILLIVIAIYLAILNRRLRIRVLQLEKRLKRSPIAD